MIRYEIRDAAIAISLPTAIAAGMLAVSHHVLPWQHEGRLQVAAAGAAHAHAGTEGTTFTLPPGVEKLLQQQPASDSHDTLDRIAVGVGVGGPCLLWPFTSFLSRRREELQHEAAISPSAIPDQSDAAQTEMIHIA